MLAPTPQKEAPVRQFGVVDAHHSSGTGGGDDVAERERRYGNVGAESGRRTAQCCAHCVTRIFDHFETVPVGNLADHVPIRGVPDEVGDQDCTRARPDHRLDGMYVDVEGIGLHVDENRNDSSVGPTERCPSRMSLLT
jgi:hypothetical protein